MQRHAFGEKRGGREHTFSHFSPACTLLFFPHKQHKAKKERHKSLPLCRGAASFPGIIPKHGSTDNGSRVLSSSSLWDYITRTLDLVPFFLPHLVFTLGVLFSLTIRGASFALFNYLLLLHGFSSFFHPLLVPTPSVAEGKQPLVQEILPPPHKYTRRTFFPIPSSRHHFVTSGEGGKGEKNAYACNRYIFFSFPPPLSLFLASGPRK